MIVASQCFRPQTVKNLLFLLYENLHLVSINKRISTCFAYETERNDDSSWQHHCSKTFCDPTAHYEACPGPQSVGTTLSPGTRIRSRRLLYYFTDERWRQRSLGFSEYIFKTSPSCCFLVFARLSQRTPMKKDKIILITGYPEVLCAFLKIHLQTYG